jgi:hypothetical protein
MTKQIDWLVGDGKIYLDFTGHGDGAIVVTSDDNNLYEQRQQEIAIQTTNEEVSCVVTIIQKAKEPNFLTIDGNALVTSDGKYFNIRDYV